MTEERIIVGEWFLPTNREHRVHGTLTYHPQVGTELELYGSLDGDDIFPQFKDQEIILGLTKDSKQVTLYSCNMTKSGGATLVQGEESGKPSLAYSIIFALIGCHGNTVEDLKFSRISSEIFNLGEWIGISGFENHPTDYEKFKKYEITIEYKLPDKIEFKIDKEATGIFNFVANTPRLPIFQKTVSITQRVELQVDVSEDKNIDELLKYVVSFQNFLTLALYKSTYPISIKLSGDRHKKNYSDGSTQNKSITLLFSSSNIRQSETPKFGFEMLFDYQLIKADFPKIIAEWFSKYELLEPAFDLVFEQFYNGNKFTVNTFLNLAQSAETFHARIHNQTRIPRAEYKKMKEDIFKVVDSDYHPWLNEQFNFGNNLNLHSRLVDLTNKYSNKILDNILGDKTDFVLKVKNSRNYYTHYSSAAKKKALKGGELFYLSERLKILLVCSFLIEIGLDKDVLSSSLDYQKWRLFNHLANWREA
jgi:hypothetical protein